MAFIARMQESWRRRFERSGLNPPPPIPEHTNEETKNRHRKRFAIFWIATLVAYTLILVSSIFLWEETTLQAFGVDFPINYGRLVVILSVLYFIGSFRLVPESMVGCHLILSIPIRHLEAGPVWIPLLISRLILFPGTLQQDELPGNPEEIFRNEDTKEVPKGFFPPNRVTFARKEGSSDPLDQRITAEVPFIVAWRIDDTVRLVNEIGADPTSALLEVKRQMNDTAVARMTAYYGKTLTVREAIAQLTEASVIVKEAIDDTIRHWGIDAPRAEVKSIGLNHSLNNAMAKVPEAQYAADQMAQEGRGIALKAKESGITPQDTLAADIAKEFARGGNSTIIGGGGLADVIAAVRAGTAQPKQTQQSSQGET